MKGFGDRKVLDDITFNLPTGKYSASWRSGTGESVTPRLMIGLEKSDSGKVMVRGKDVGFMAGQGLSKVKRKMGFLSECRSARFVFRERQPGSPTSPAG